MAAGDLTTLASVKTWLGITATTDDVQLARMVTAASDYIKAWLSRDITSTIYTNEKYHGTGNGTLVVRQWPITAIASITVDGSLVDPSLYAFDGRFIYLNNGYAFNKGRANVVVTYTAGYTTTPPSLEQACIEFIGMKYRERERIGHSSKNIGGETVAFIVTDLHPNVKTILRQYSNKVPV